MKTVVEVTDMKTVQKLANIVRLWYFFFGKSLPGLRRPKPDS